MRDTGAQLEAPHRLLAARPADSHHNDERGSESDCKYAQQRDVGGPREPLPGAGKRDQHEDAEQPQYQPDPRPQIFEKERTAAPRDLAFEGAARRKNRNQAPGHGVNLARKALATI